MNKRTKIFIIASFLIGLIIGGIGFVNRGAIASYLSGDEPTVTVNTFRTYEFFASTTAVTKTATTTTATSTNIAQYIDTSGRVDKGYFVVKGAKKVQMYFNRGDNNVSGEGGQANVGTSTFRVEVSPDGTTWFAWTRLLELTSTSTTAELLAGELYSTVPKYGELTKTFEVGGVVTNVEITPANLQIWGKADNQTGGVFGWVKSGKVVKREFPSWPRLNLSINI